MTVINTNTGALYAQSAMNTNARGLSTVMQQLSTGKRINNAVDDVAGLAISTRLTSQIKGLDQAVRNANDGISLIQTAEGATEQITNMLQRMRELAVQSSNDTNNSNDRSFLNGEFQQLRQEINRIGQNTQWNGANIIDGTGGNSANGTFAFQVGANANQTITTSLSNMQTYTAVTMTTATAATANTYTLTGLDAANLDVLGRVVTVNIGEGSSSTQLKYKITQDDINAVTTTTSLSSIVATNIAAQQVTGQGIKINGHALTAAGSTGTTGTLTLTVSAATGALSGSATSAAGVLTAIASNDITTGTNAYATLGAIDSAMQTVNSNRSAMGAVISRLQFASDNLTNISAKATESRSRIEDTDYSVATTELAKRNIIQQAAQAMLAQANQAPQMVLQLLK